MDKLALEDAIIDAEGAVAVLTILEDHLTASVSEGWETLKLAPREDLRVTALTPIEDRALRHASRSLVQAVREVSRVFYGPDYDPHAF